MPFKGRPWKDSASRCLLLSGGEKVGTKNPYAVIVGAVDIPAHAKIADLDHKSLTHQAVARGQVPMHKVQTRQVHHSGSHLASHGQQLRQAQGAWSHVLSTSQQLGIRPVGPRKDREKGRAGRRHPQDPEEGEHGELGWHGGGKSGKGGREEQRRRQSGLPGWVAAGAATSRASTSAHMSHTGYFLSGNPLELQAQHPATHWPYISCLWTPPPQPVPRCSASQV